MFKSFSSLAIHQFFKLLVPLLLIPYFIKTVGAENWGQIVYTQYFFSFFIIFITYGFNIYGIQLIATKRENQEELNEVVSAIISIKLILFFISLLIIFATTLLFEKFNNLSIIFLYSIGLLIFQVCQSIWIFQGIEKMFFIPIITGIESAIQLLGVFFFVRQEHDYLFIPLIQSLALVVSSLLSILFIIYFAKVRFKFISLIRLIDYTKDGFQFFFSRICDSISSKSVVVVLGLFLPYKYVTYFDLSLKIIQGLTIPFGIFSEVIFPKISRSKNLKKANQYLFYAFVTSSLLYLSLFYFSDKLMYIIGGAGFLDFKPLFLILGLMIPLDAVCFILGTSFLISFGFQKEFNLSSIYGTAIYLVIILVLVGAGKVDGFAFASLIAFISFVVFAIRVIYSYKHRLFVIKSGTI